MDQGAWIKGSLTGFCRSPNQPDVTREPPRWLGHPMTPIELHRLAGAVSCLRPDWPAQSVQTFLERHFTHRPLRDIAVALVYVAADPSSTTPARVLEAGPWWHASATRDVPRSVNTCVTHPHSKLRIDARTGEQECSGCRNDRQADENAQARFVRRPPSDEARRLAQAATPTGATGAAS